MLQKIFTHRISGLLIFFLIMALIFHLTFNVAGRALSVLLTGGIDKITGLISHQLLDAGVSPTLHALVVDGICTGVGSVLSFIPIIAVLFFLLSLLEESGYLSQISSLMDKPFRRIGLPGQAVVSMIMGFGCSVPAIMSCSALPSKRERYITMLLIPFMSCSAKLPIYGTLAGVFFFQNRTSSIIAVYLVGITVAVLCSVVLNRFADLHICRTQFPTGSHCGSAIRCTAGSIQPLRLPSLRKVMIPVINSCLGFIKKAFSVIFAASIIIWILQHFDTTLHMTDNIEDSILASFGKSAAPVFAPLGFGDWRAASALIAGLSAKEAVLSTLAILSGSAGGAGLTTLLNGIFTPASAFSFMVFCLLYVPCIATLTVIRKETGSLKISLAMLLGQTVIAWCVSFLLFHTATLII